jgi:hypothetical protein
VHPSLEHVPWQVGIQFQKSTFFPSSIPKLKNWRDMFLNFFMLLGQKLAVVTFDNMEI